MNKYVLIFNGLKWYSLDVSDFNKFNIDCNPKFSLNDVIITPNTSDFIRNCKSNNLNIPQIVDLECFDKQMSQEGKDVRCFDNWTALKMLKYHKIIESSFLLTENTFQFFLEQIATFYLSQLEINITEIPRFNTIESKINQIIYERQKLGLTIDIEIAERKSSEIEREIYKIKNILQLQHNIFDPDSKTQQIKWLNKKGYTVFESLLDSFKVRKDEDCVCKLIYNLIRCERDLDGLLYILGRWGGDSKVYPSYHGFGTITSRITLREPALQSFRKENRCILIPDLGKKFMYVDYSQFEAGILASLSDEKELVSLYNEDIYTDLAKFVFNDELRRAEAKIIFTDSCMVIKLLGKM